MPAFILFWGREINRCKTFTELFSISDNEEYPSDSYIKHQQLSAGSTTAPSESFTTTQKHK